MLKDEKNVSNLEKISFLKNIISKKIDAGWLDFVNNEFEKEYFNNLLVKLYDDIYINENIVYPPINDWLNALTISPDNLKVIILGQDPYHGENQAHGFSFSVLPGIKIPPSLKNMYKEIKSEFNVDMNMSNGTLTPWVEQGVMLLNSILTVRQKTPASHKDFGWATFTDNLITHISDNFDKKVFFLWGAFSKSKANLINSKKHKILESAHPSPFSAHNGFFGNNHFKLANEYIISNGEKEINWQIL